MPNPATVRLETLELPTYARGVDSPYPIYHIYPYTLRDLVTDDARLARHRVVVLENEHLRAVVLPDMGGRLFSLYDKDAGQESFMVPPTIKFQNISLRGAWIAGGIEWNFGRHGHTVHTVTPVSWAMRQEPDGTAAVWVGSALKPTDTRWSVRMSLKPGRAALDVAISTMAPPVLPGNMYWWSNAAIDVDEQTRFFYAGMRADTRHILHSWPMLDGQDLTWYRNRWTASDMFLLEPQRDHMAVYNYGRRHGLAQTSDVRQAPGQKYFTWGRHQQGRYYDLMLSDSEQTYCEIQRGRLPTQGETERMEPMTTESWAEVWMPFADTHGFSGMESDIVLSVADDDQGRATLHVRSAERHANATITAMKGDRVLGRWTVRALVPGRTWANELPRGGRTCDHVTIVDGSGRSLVDWRPFVPKDEDWVQELPSSSPDPITATPEEAFLEAERVRTFAWPNSLDDVRAAHMKILAKDPGHTGSLRAMAEICIQAGQCDLALEHLAKASKRLPYDPDLQTLTGWAALRLGRFDEAAKAFRTAARYEGGRRNGWAGLAWVYLRRGLWEDAAKAVDDLLAERPRDKWGRLLRVIVLRKSGRVREARDAIRALLAEDPIWYRPHAEALLLGEPVRLADGKPPLADDCVTAALPYIELAMWDDALKILSTRVLDDTTAESVRLAHAAYVRRQRGDAAAARDLQRLRREPVEYAHPWATGSIEVLRELAADKTGVPLVQHMLGNLLASRGRSEEAEAAWKRAVGKGLRNRVTWYNLSQRALARGDKREALKLCRLAWKAAKDDVHLFAYYDSRLAAAGLHGERLDAYEELSERSRGLSKVATRRVMQLRDTDRFDEAIRELERRTFQSREFEAAIWWTYIEVLMGKGIDLIRAHRWEEAEAVLRRGLEYPRNMNYGRHGVMPDEAPINYLLGLVAEARGDEARAQRFWRTAADELHEEAGMPQAYEMMAWQALGVPPRAMAIMRACEQAGRGERTVRASWTWPLTPANRKLVYGLAQMAKGRIAEARSAWTQGHRETPEARWLRIHLRMPDEFLKRMCRQITGKD